MDDRRPLSEQIISDLEFEMKLMHNEPGVEADGSQPSMSSLARARCDHLIDELIAKSVDISSVARSDLLQRKEEKKRAIREWRAGARDDGVELTSSDDDGNEEDEASESGSSSSSSSSVSSSSTSSAKSPARSPNNCRIVPPTGAGSSMKPSSVDDKDGARPEGNDDLPTGADFNLFAPPSRDELSDVTPGASPDRRSTTEFPLTKDDFVIPPPPPPPNLDATKAVSQSVVPLLNIRILDRKQRKAELKKAKHAQKVAEQGFELVPCKEKKKKKRKKDDVERKHKDAAEKRDKDDKDHGRDSSSRHRSSKSRDRSPRRRRDDSRDRRRRRSSSAERWRPRRSDTRVVSAEEKKRLYETAIRKAAEMGVLAPNRGKSYVELVAYCHKLQAMQDRDTKKAEEQVAEEVGDEDDTRSVHHPFAAPPVTAFTIPILVPSALRPGTPAVYGSALATSRPLNDRELRISFPISSGALHRHDMPELRSNVWAPADGDTRAKVDIIKRKPEEASKSNNSDADGKTGSKGKTKSKTAERKPDKKLSKEEKMSLSKEERAKLREEKRRKAQEPAFTISAEEMEVILDESTGETRTADSQASTLYTGGAIGMENLPASTAADNAMPPLLPLSAIVSMRAEMNMRLASSPNDFEALQRLKECDVMMSQWAAWKARNGGSSVEGAETPSTAVPRLLTAEELAPHDPKGIAWARTTMLKTAKKVEGGIGMKLLLKMGWRQGDGLGRQRQGNSEPLALDVKSDRRGLSAQDEKSGKAARKRAREELAEKHLAEIEAAAAKARMTRPGGDEVVGTGPPTWQFGSAAPPKSQPPARNAGKNPVCAVHELCQKFHWSAPEFTCIEEGPPSNRLFSWTAIINGVAYETNMPSKNKKDGKVQVCEVILQSLGLVRNR